MKKPHIIMSLMCSILMAISPAAVKAEESPPLLSPILVTEIQAGTTRSGSEELVELYNTTIQPIDFSQHEWHLEIASTSATNWQSPLRRVRLQGVINPGQSYIVAAPFMQSGVQIHPQGAGAEFAAGITDSAGHIRLTYAEERANEDGGCSPTVVTVDVVEWSARRDSQPSTPSLDGRSVFLTNGIPKTMTLQRLATPLTGTYIDTDNDMIDFGEAAPSPRAKNTVQALQAPVSWQPVVGLPSGICEPTTPEEPAEHPDPGSESPVEELPTIPPENDPAESGTPPTDPNDSLQYPYLSELLPNPASPQTDDADEFIELYNPNDVPFDLSGFVLEAGGATKRRFIFPDETRIEARSYRSFFSADTDISLPNTSGQARLMNVSGEVISTADAYTNASDGQVWIFIAGKWQWSTTPTPHAPNALAPMLAAVKKNTAVKASTTTKKAATSTKTATTKTTKPTAKKTTTSTNGNAPIQTVAATNRSPLHPGVLAAAGAFAILYGAYEYRHDLANRFQQFRNYRAARRKTG
jgi:hypothetical protein